MADSNPIKLCECGCGRPTAIPKHNNKFHGQVAGVPYRYIRGHMLKGASTKHGRAHDPIYAVWDSMVRRCTNPNHKSWARYGGRGIKVCVRWLHSFPNFLADMGERPDGLTLDRINNDGNYEPGNCRWATPKEQIANQRRRSDSHMLEAFGESKTLTEWTKDKRCAVNRNTLHGRIRWQWPAEQAISLPASKFTLVSRLTGGPHE